VWHALCSAIAPQSACQDLRSVTTSQDPLALDVSLIRKGLPKNRLCGDLVFPFPFPCYLNATGGAVPVEFPSALEGMPKAVQIRCVSECVSATCWTSIDALAEVAASRGLAPSPH